MIGQVDGETSLRASRSNQRRSLNQHSQPIFLYLILEASTYQLPSSRRPSQTSSPWRCQSSKSSLRSNQWRNNSIRWVSSHITTTAIKIKWASSRCIRCSSRWGNWVSKQVKRETLMFRCKLCSKYSRCSCKCSKWWGACRWASRWGKCPRCHHPRRMYRMYHHPMWIWQPSRTESWTTFSIVWRLKSLLPNKQVSTLLNELYFFFYYR